MSNFSKFVDAREIKKKVDQLGGSETSPEPLKPVVSTPVETKLTEPRVLADDNVKTAKAIKQEIQLAIDDITTRHSTDLVFSTHFAVAKAQFLTPTEIAAGAQRPATPTPPQQLQKIVERDIYRRQNDPQILLVKDLYRLLGQVDAILYTYQIGWERVLQATRLYKVIDSNPLLSNILHKDKQLLKDAQAKAKKIKELGPVTPTGGFSSGFAEFCIGNSAYTAQFAAQAVFLLEKQIDTAFDEYFTLDDTLTHSIGDLNAFAYGRVMRSPSIGILFGSSHPMLDSTEDLEVRYSVLDPDPLLMEFRRELDAALLKTLQETESNYGEQERIFLQTNEARTHIYENINRSTKLKFFAATCAKLGGIPTHDFDKAEEVMKQSVAQIKDSPLRQPAENVLKAAKLLGEWIK